MSIGNFNISKYFINFIEVSSNFTSCFPKKYLAADILPASMRPAPAQRPRCPRQTMAGASHRVQQDRPHARRRRHAKDERACAERGAFTQAAFVWMSGLNLESNE